MIDVAKLSRTQNDNARRVKRLVEVSSVPAVSQALGISPASVRLAVDIADILDDADQMRQIHDGKV